MTVHVAVLVAPSLRRWYARVMRQVVQHPWPDGQEGEEDFAVFLSSLLMDHAAVPQPLSRGVLELPERSVTVTESLRELGSIRVGGISRTGGRGR